MIVMVIVRVMMVAVDRVDEASLLEQRMRSDGRPDGRQQQRKHATDKPHARSVNKLFAFATLEMGLRATEADDPTRLRTGDTILRA